LGAALPARAFRDHHVSASQRSESSCSGIPETG
jgi:hypothetical protein